MSIDVSGSGTHRKYSTASFVPGPLLCRVSQAIGAPFPSIGPKKGHRMYGNKYGGHPIALQNNYGSTFFVLHTGKVPVQSQRTTLTD